MPLRRASSTGLRALLIAACTAATIGEIHAAGFDEVGVYANPRPNPSIAAVVNEGRQKSLSVASQASISAAAPIEDRDVSRCGEKAQAFCRDLAASEFQITSLRFMLPEVRGLSPKSLNIRRNSVSATYTFR